MKFKRVTAIALCAAALFVQLTSCAGDTDKAEEKPSAAVGDDISDGTGIDYEAAYSAFAPDTVMLTAGGLDVTWDVLYYFICAAIGEVTSATGVEPDWGAETEGQSLSFDEQIMTRALDSVMTCKAIEYAAGEVGVSLTDDDRAEISLNQESAESQLGGREAFLEYLNENHASYDVYIYLSGIDYLYENIVTEKYGEGAEQYPDSDVELYIGDEGFIMVKHIFLKTTETDEDGEEIPMTEEEAEATLAEAEEILAELKAYSGDDFGAYFDEAMSRFSEDSGGLNMYPGGYLFREGQAMPELEAAALNMDIGELSDVIRSESGYHIIYRLPIDYDAVPQEYSWTPMNTLRAVAARDAFGHYLEELKIEMGKTESDAYKNLDLASVFK